MSYQMTVIVGNVGKDPEARLTPDGKSVTNFSVAVNDAKDVTTWFSVTAWDKRAEFAQKYLEKGSKVVVQGRLRSEKPRIWKHQDGTPDVSYELTADVIRFAGPRRDQGSGLDVNPESQDEIPF